MNSSTKDANTQTNKNERSPQGTSKERKKKEGKKLNTNQKWKKEKLKIVKSAKIK